VGRVHFAGPIESERLARRTRSVQRCLGCDMLLAVYSPKDPEPALPLGYAAVVDGSLHLAPAPERRRWASKGLSACTSIVDPALDRVPA